MASPSLISVICPVYNVAPYLRRCIDSILCQTYTNFELILVDDGSTDDSGIICDEYAAKDYRIRVIHQANQGVSAARNSGLQVARGKYFVVPDPDDYVEPTYLEDLIRPISEYDYDVIYSGYIHHIGSKNIQYTRILPKCYKQEDLHSFICHGYKFFSGHFSILFKTEHTWQHGIYYPTNVSIGEDLLFLFLYLSYAKSGRSVNALNYHYIAHNASLSNSVSIINYMAFYKKFKSLFLKYLTTKSDSCFSQYLKSMEIEFIDNLINTIYQNKYSTKQRIGGLSEIDWLNYRHNKCPYSWHSAVLKFLLIHRLFRIYDWIHIKFLV